MTDLNATLDAALDSAARELNDGTSDVDTLAMLFLADLDRDQAGEVLRFLVGEAIGDLIARCCLLDETDQHSYSVEGQLADSLTHAIFRQGRELAALRELAADRISSRAHCIAVLAPAG